MTNQIQFMSNVSNPNPEHMDDRMESDHNQLHEINRSSPKRKFEGWPILWILLVVSIISAIIWYTESAADLLNWIEKK